MGSEAERSHIEAALEPFVRDVQATLDPDFEVPIRCEPDGLWMWSVSGVVQGQGSTWGSFPDDLDLAELTAYLADDIPEGAFDEVLEPWPRCPAHGDHPLYAKVRDGRAVWWCRNGGNVAIPIGELERSSNARKPH